MIAGALAALLWWRCRPKSDNAAYDAILETYKTRQATYPTVTTQPHACILDHDPMERAVARYLAPRRINAALVRLCCERDRALLSKEPVALLGELSH